MPHALTDRQREYLEFLRQFIRENQQSPRLDELAEHFGVKPPSAHKMLKALAKKGYLHFERSPQAGFFIRLFERTGSVARVMEVPIVGKVNRFGELYEFPKMHGHFPSVFNDTQPDAVGISTLAHGGYSRSKHAAQ